MPQCFFVENPHISDVISAGYDTDAVAYGL